MFGLGTVFVAVVEVVGRIAAVVLMIAIGVVLRVHRGRRR